MRILAVWDNLTEAEEIDSFLNVGDNTARVLTDEAALDEAIQNAGFDILLLALDFPEKSRRLAVLSGFAGRFLVSPSWVPGRRATSPTWPSSSCTACTR